MTRKRSAPPKDDVRTDPADADDESMPAAGAWPLGERTGARLRRWAERNGHEFVQVNVDPGADRRAMLVAIGQAFAFPAWYGANLDALYDCLTDLPERGAARGCVALIEGLAPPRGAADAAAGRHAAVIEVFADAAQQLAQVGYALRVFYGPRRATG